MILTTVKFGGLETIDPCVLDAYLSLNIIIVFRFEVSLSSTRLDFGTCCSYWGDRGVLLSLRVKVFMIDIILATISSLAKNNANCQVRGAHHQNGLAESKNKTVSYGTKKILLHARRK